MFDRMFVRPNPDGRQVRDPQTMQHLPLTGADVPCDVYWMRRLAAGDVIAAEPAQPTDGDE